MAETGERGARPGGDRGALGVHGAGGVTGAGAGGPLRPGRSSPVRRGPTRQDAHLVDVVPGRDFQPEAYADLRLVEEGDRCPRCAGTLRVLPGGSRWGMSSVSERNTASRFRPPISTQRGKEQVDRDGVLRNRGGEDGRRGNRAAPRSGRYPSGRYRSPRSRCACCR